MDSIYLRYILSMIILLTDFKLPSDTCVHVLSLCLTQLVSKGVSCGSTVS